MNQMIADKTNRAAIILAGGEGTRLAELTRGVDGLHVPKQFCALLEDIPLRADPQARLPVRSIRAGLIRTQSGP